MKKTLTVNISGQVFHIDEDAYRVLNDYLQSIKQHFSKTRGGDEIYTDIEARIAEMLKERMQQNKEVITIEDISQVIQTIGDPGEFGTDTEEQSTTGKQDINVKSVKRLYRDPDHAMLGGVCSGLAAYFHTDVVWFRLGFAVAAIVGFGAPVLVYLVLWIVVPEANTLTEKLEMKGEKVNLSNISQSVREEIEKVKSKFNDFASEARSNYKKKSEEYTPNAQRAGYAIVKLVEVFVRIILVFIGVILFIIGISLVIAFLALVFGLGHQIFVFDTELIFIPVPHILTLITGQTDASVFIKTGLILLLGIPVLMILWGGIKLIFGIERTKFAGILFFNLWILGLIICVYYGYKYGKSFRYPGNYQEARKIEVRTDTLITLKVAEAEKFNRLIRNREVIEIEDLKMVLDPGKKEFFYGIPEMKIEKSPGHEVELDMIKMAKGKTGSDADSRAARTVYNYISDHNTLILDPFFILPENELWRVQQVVLIMHVPVGTHLKFEANMDEIVEDDFYFKGDLDGKIWVMSETGLIEENTQP